MTKRHALLRDPQVQNRRPATNPIEIHLGLAHLLLCPLGDLTKPPELPFGIRERFAGFRRAGLESSDPTHGRSKSGPRLLERQSVAVLSGVKGRGSTTRLLIRAMQPIDRRRERITTSVPLGECNATGRLRFLEIGGRLTTLRDTPFRNRNG
jgi:hypothetical protein